MPGHRVQAHGLVSRGTAVLTQAQKAAPRRFAVGPLPVSHSYSRKVSRFCSISDT